MEERQGSPPGWRIAGLGFVVLVTAILHGAYSWIGFNPTDDGFLLALSRRILDGQVPHRDFVFIRPAGSPLLHTLWLLAGGDRCLMLGRLFVWFQIVVFSWIWIRLLASERRAVWSLPSLLGLGLTAVFLNAHNYPLMPWYTFDGIFFATVGIGLMWRGGASAVPGALALGYAVLCKQNFLVVGLAGIMLLGRARELRIWTAFALPPSLYLLGLLTAGGFADFLEQIFAQTGLIRWGILPFLSTPGTAWGIVIGVTVLHPLLRGALTERFGERDPTFPTFERSIVLLVVLGFGISQASHLSPYYLDLQTWSYLVFGILVGLTACDLGYESPGAEETKLRLLLLVTAWCASVSVGYAFPALLSGTLLAAIALRCRGGRGPAWPLGLAALLAIAGLQHHRCRTSEPYRDLPADQLTHSLGEVLRGGEGIRTNARTYAFLKDLDDLVKKMPGQRLAILEDASAFWIRSAQSNPLPVEWPLISETPRPELLDRSHSSVFALRGQVVFLVQKYAADRIHREKSEQFSPLYSLIPLVRSRMQRVGESEYFEIYR